MKHICHTLSGVVYVTLKVYKSRSLLKDSVFVALSYSVHKLFLISMAFSDIHIIADTDHISHKGNHVGCFADSFAVSDLRFFLIQILNLKAKKVACRSKGETGSCGVVAENRNPETALKYLCGNVVFSHKTESVRNSKNSFQLFICLIPCPEKVVIVHLLEIQCI